MVTHNGSKIWTPGPLGKCSPHPYMGDPQSFKSALLNVLRSTEWIGVCSCCKKMYRAWTETSNFRIVVQNDGKFCPSCSIQALARKIKLLTFYRNWEIRKVFTKGRQNSWRQNFFLVQPIERWKTPFMGKKCFKAWHCTTHTNHHWEMFFFLCFS